MAIEVERIATNRYAPSGSDAITLFTNGEAHGLSFGQLVMSVCIKSAAVYEAESVLKMNTISSSSVKLDTASEWLEKIANGSADWSAAEAYLTGTLGIESSALPSDIGNYTTRMTAVAALKAKIDAMVQTQQRDMIDLQTLVNRRDLAYSTSSNVIRSIGTAVGSEAANF